ncbi:tRNA lysidine(34) synthetase TilS [Stackebrandtia nassauensis]|uniref:tRNA(Ile)-lysidine synthase n=1 Tax=Stackebrandtia nassauensis (strain DSM 44728 / CIP 108903 / NRRL B-16338 / NBRC 102104 / LLR-40K-21) TaxID=446470 RepID=D3Q838_STANL|nr:tRNA lysidine(34) synthetase TilS [Stackebrandtia nassauensis]ADD40543.1 tRNA(Ile)-lysidine synthetase [Stackebrandtia nassauensis DSM 44728]
MTGPPAAVARVRVAVRRLLTELSPSGNADESPSSGDRLVLVACSGGPDSMALAAATAFVAPRLGIRAGLVTVDHGLQAGSAKRAATVADWARDAGFEPVEVATVEVDVTAGGPEGAARDARYAALTEAAQRLGASAVLLGHTRDDQAETVLLALARGSGPRGLAAMPRKRRKFRRPLLDLPRADTVRACRDLELPVWDDPHNTDPAYARSRLRAVMPVLAETFGERFVANLARTATLVAADNDALDAYAAEVLAKASHGTLSAELLEPNLKLGPLNAARRAVRTRALRAWVLSEGAEADALSYVHIEAMEALVMNWRGQGPVFLPGNVTVWRERNRLRLRRTEP